VVPRRSVLIRDPEGRFEPQALLAANQKLGPAQLLTYFVRQWQMETRFEEARAHLRDPAPMESKAIARTTPALLALFVIATLMAAYLIGTNTGPARMARAIAKRTPPSRA